MLISDANHPSIIHASNCSRSGSMLDVSLVPSRTRAVGLDVVEPRHLFIHAPQGLSTTCCVPCERHRCSKPMDDCKHLETSIFSSRHNGHGCCEADREAASVLQLQLPGRKMASMASYLTCTRSRPHVERHRDRDRLRSSYLQSLTALKEKQRSVRPCLSAII